jgi:hypothetical protein
LRQLDTLIRFVHFNCARRRRQQRQQISILKSRREKEEEDEEEDTSMKERQIATVNFYPRDSKHDSCCMGCLPPVQRLIFSPLDCLRGHQCLIKYNRKLVAAAKSLS